MNFIEAATEAGFRERNGSIRVQHSNGSFVVVDEQLGRFAEIIRSQALAELEAKLAQQAEAQEPLFWYRPCADGLYEGPHHNNAVLGRMLREEKPGEWKPLFTRPQPAQKEPE